MQISWDDVNRTEKVGICFVTRLRIDIFVSQRAIDNWRTDPEGRHSVVVISTSLGNMYGLGVFEPSKTSASR
jgi:hypothetical protein